MKHWIRIVATAAGLACACTAGAVDVEDYLKIDSFGQIKISPTGEYFAATVPMDDGAKTALVIMSRADNSVTGTFVREKNTHIDGFTWVSPERVLISVAEKLGALETPVSTGELYAMNADGSRSEILIGQRVQGPGRSTKIKTKKVEQVWAQLVDGLPDDDDHVIVSVIPFHADPYTDAYRMNVYSGRRVKVASAPVQSASFITDNRGVIRFAAGSGSDNFQKLFYRTDGDAAWELLNDESVSGVRQSPVGFSADDRTVYFEAERRTGPNAIVSFDVQSRTFEDVLRGPRTDPAGMIYRNGSAVPVGAWFMDGKPTTEFFDGASPEARLQRSLEAAFAGSAVAINSRTTDGRLALVEVWSDRNPGDFYVFDTVSMKADHLLSRRTWFDPVKMASKRPVEITARDGLVLHGYLSVPAGAGATALPTVVMPHGGPFGIRDGWGFESDVQMLTDAGYAVMQINFRGSDGYGKSFQAAGARQWGLAMQDDLTDATHWLVEQGISPADRICIYGASYGAYASLMGAAREPELYRCAAGYVGVYDLPTLHTANRVRRSASAKTEMTDWIGERDTLAAVSPNRLAEQITVPVFLAAGGEDEVAPIQHSRMMERALVSAGGKVETLYYSTEGHGFYAPEHRREYYTRLLAFLAAHLGGEVATTSGGGAAEAVAK